jgi:hypothetical protein
MKASELVNKKWFSVLAMSITFAWMMITNFGGKLPYIVTENSFNIRAYILFPLILFFFIYIIFLHKWEETQSTGFQMALVGSSKKSKIKQLVIAIFGSILGAAMFSWLARDTIASVAYFVANKPYVERFTVYSTRSVSNLTEVELQNLSNQQRAYLRLKHAAFGKGIWEYGAIVKIEGRTSIFGAIAENATRLK